MRDERTARICRLVCSLLPFARFPLPRRASRCLPSCRAVLAVLLPSWWRWGLCVRGCAGLGGVVCGLCSAGVRAGLGLWRVPVDVSPYWSMLESREQPRLGSTMKAKFSMPHPAIVCGGPQLLSVIKELEAGTYPQPEDAIWRDDLPRDLAVRLARATGATDEQIAEISAV